VNHPFGPAHLTPLMRAILARSPRTVQLLMDHGADLTPLDRKGRTARDVARETGDAELIRILAAASPTTRPGA
jgi:ankyrin repeat protein